MKKKVLRYIKFGVVGVLFAVFIVIAVTPASGIAREEVNRVTITESDVSLAVSNSYVYEEDNVVSKIEGSDFVPDKNCDVTNDTLVMREASTASCQIDITQAGKYKVVFDVYVSSEKPIDNLLNMVVAGEEQKREYSVILPVLWKDATKEYSVDRFGNETIPEQFKVNTFVKNTVVNSASIYGEDLVLSLEKGSYKLELNNETEEIQIRSIQFVEEAESIDYSEYIEQYTDSDVGNAPCITIEAENYVVKSDSYISSSSVKNASLYPYNNDYDLINVLDGGSSDEAGQEVTYVIDVPQSGMYSLAFHYSQMNVEDMCCFKTVKIDGKVLYKQLENIEFPYTAFSYNTKLLTDDSGENYKIYLEEGTHTLSVRTDGKPYMNECEKLNSIMAQIRTLALDIKKVTGNSTDKYRTWNMEDFIPGISDTLYQIADDVDSVYLEIQSKCGNKPSFASTLNVASANLRMLAEEPDKLPNNMALFSDGSSSVSQRLAGVCDSLSSQNVTIDRIYLYGEGTEIEEVRISPIQTIKNGVIRFVHSFQKEYQGYSSAQSKESDSLVIWMNRPIQYVTLLQQMADSEFTQETGIDVEIYIMPNESKLVLSNATGSNPDVALSVSNQTPYNLALRGAAHPLSEFDDFYSYVSGDYNLAAYSGLVLDNETYGFVETCDFYVMVYRTDIMESLGIPVPQTWEDVIGIMPKLHRYGMNFYTPMAGNKGSKYLHETTPYLFQAGASLMSTNGLSVDFTGENSYKGFETMTDLYLKYSLSQDTPNFYHNFRYGTMPIGVINYSTYLLIKNAAPEIAEEWEMTLVPGTIRENGVNYRYQIAGDKCDMIFANSEKKEEGWEFIKWWMSEETQLEYANLLMTHYGPEYFWNTANMSAFENYSMDQDEINVVLEQWKNHTKELQKHPATYMIEREISNIWSAVVVNGADLRTTLVQAEQTVNREIQVKLKEFGYIVDGKVVRDYPVLTDEELMKLFLQPKE